MVFSAEKPRIMSKSLRKYLALVLIALLMVTMLAGCGKKKEEPAVDEVETQDDTSIDDVDEVEEVEDEAEDLDELADEVVDDVEEETDFVLDYSLE